MPYDGKLSTDRRYPVSLYDNNMSGVAGVASGSIGVRYFHENDTTWSGMTVTGTDWRELGGGMYTIAMGANEFNQSGLYSVSITGAANATWKYYNFTVEVYREWPANVFYTAYTKLPAGTIADGSAGVTATGITGPALSTIVTSGNAANWNSVNGITATGLSASVVTLLVNSGNAANWNSSQGVTATGLSTTTLASIVSTGNANNWNGTLGVTATGLSSTVYTNITSNGNAAGWNDTFDAGDISNIITSGNAAGWNTTNANVTGVIPAALSAIITSGNAANWNSTTGITATGLSAAVVTLLINSGNAANWNDTFTNADIADIITSGNAAGWNTDTATVTGFANSALSQIVASGNAANWSGVTDVSSLATSAQIVNISGTMTTQNSYYTSTRAGYLDKLNIAGNVASSGQIAALNNISVNDIFNWIISGSTTASGVLNRVLAYVAGNITHSGLSNTFTNIYKDALGATLYTATVTASGRTIS